jgi:pimeloyl-ACP methyl ester carboxylesterase
MTIELKYLVYLPGDYTSSEESRWPLILFLHGAGERGDDLEMVKKHGPPKLVEEGKEFSFIIVSPQCPLGQWWSAELLNRLLDKIITEYRIDEDRVYLTGLSMGGFGTWDLASKYPDRFAAIAPICGGSHPELAWNMRHIPAWVFHGEKDEVVPVGLSKIMVGAMKKYNPEVLLTLYPEATHDSWTETYDNQELYEWFLQHKRYKPQSVSTNVQLFKNLAGEYHFIYDNRQIMITSSGTNLFAEEIEGVKISLIPESPYTYRFRNSNGGITFQLNNKGKVTGLIYHHDGEMAAQKAE